MQKPFFLLTICFTFTLLGHASLSIAKGGCPSGKDLQDQKNESLQKACGSNIRFNLLNFKNDVTSLCSSQTSAIDMIEQTLIKICSGSAKELTSQIHRIQVTAWPKNESQYKIKNNVLVAQVSSDESYMISNWVKEADQLKEFLRSSTGSKLHNAEEKKLEESQKQADKAQQEKIINAEKKDSLRKSKEQKRKAAQEKFAAAKETFASKTKSLWAEPGNTPADIERKNKEAAKLTETLNQAAEVFKKELEEANR